MKANFLLFLIIFQQVTYSQTVKYSTSWFGPNANPVPEFTDARIPAKTTLSLMVDNYFGFGDNTKNVYAKIEIPLIPERVAFKVWSSGLEFYTLTPEVSCARVCKNETDSTTAIEKIKVQTRMLLLKETKHLPCMILNVTLRTASGTNFPQRRYFETPGYYFDAEIGKSFQTGVKFINEFRMVADLGFICWETTNSTQDDAPIYGAKIIVGNPHWNIENSLSGYHGWMHNSSSTPDYGDAPLVYSAKLSILSKKITYFSRYQFGINDFPYHQIRLGISYTFDKLTPPYTIQN